MKQIQPLIKSLHHLLHLRCISCRSAKGVHDPDDLIVDDEGNTTRELTTFISIWPKGYVLHTQLTVNLTRRGVVAFQNTSTPSAPNILAAQASMFRSGFPILCMRVLTLSNGILAYLHVVSNNTFRPTSASFTYTVTTPLPAPANIVLVVPFIASGHLSLNPSLNAPNVVNLTALFVPCLHSTGVKPLHNDSTPSALTVCATICGRDILPSRPPFALSWITRVFKLSPGVTTRMLSVAPAHRPAERLSQGLRAADALPPK